MSDTSNFITPCPFSPGFRISTAQAWQTLAVFSVYRITLASLFSILFVFQFGPSLLGKSNSELYAVTSTAYLVVTILSAIGVRLRWPRFSVQVQSQVVVDIIAITLLMHASGGIYSGIGILLVVTLAADGLLVGGRCALFFAALSTITLITEQIYSDITQAFNTTAYTYVGMLGASFFTVSMLALELAKRAEQSEALAVEKTLDLADQQQLNAFIVQHLQSSIIILDQNDHIHEMNPSALRLFQLAAMPNGLNAISPQLNQHFQKWKSGASADSVFSVTENQINVYARFTQLGKTHKTYNMIFLEDSRLNNQRVQQSKLASLGRLTASIAHEIRNPLGAISHAGQLLAECQSLEKEDRRLTEIIRQHTTRVNDIIETILQISKRKSSQTEKIKLMPWLSKFVSDFQLEQQLDKSPLHITGNGADIEVLCDPGQLKQILDNLCCNAMKYSSKESDKISLNLTQFQSMPCVEVIDHGPGISDDQINEIFEPFFTTSSSGTGLGLYIAKELAELNQAKLEYVATEDGGSCFRICLLDAKSTLIAI